MFTASFDLSGFRQMATRTIDALEVSTLTAVRLAAQAGAAEAKSSSRFKDRTGLLRSNIVAHFLRSNGRSAQWEILSRAPYSKFVNYGTAPHVILPKAQNGYSGPTRRGQTRRKDNDVGVGRGHALRWVSGGVTHFARIVHHPGTRAANFMAAGRDKAEEVLYTELRAGIAHASGLWS